jgi:hypothetical protein
MHKYVIADIIYLHRATVAEVKRMDD